MALSTTTYTSGSDEMISTGKEAADIMSTLGGAASDLLDVLDNLNVKDTMSKLSGALGKLSILGPTFAAVGAIMSIFTMFLG